MSQLKSKSKKQIQDNSNKHFINTQNMTTESFNKLRMTTESFNKFHRTNLLTPGSNISRVRLMSKNVNRNDNDEIGHLDEH